MLPIASEAPCASMRILPHFWPQLIRRYFPLLSFVTFYTVIANIPYWIASYKFGFLSLGCFCLQYATVGLISLIVPRYISATLLFIVIFLDVVSGVCMSFYLPVWECLTNFRVAYALSGARLGYAIVIVLIALLMAVASAAVDGRLLPENQRLLAAACLIVFAASALGADSISIRLQTGHYPTPSLAGQQADGVVLYAVHLPRLARVPIRRLARLARQEILLRSSEEKGFQAQIRYPSASSAGIRRAGIDPVLNKGEQPNLVLILVESWGLATDSALRHALVTSYLAPNILARYQVVQGTVPFYGPTIDGEARELCGSSAGFYLLNAPASAMKGCLPDQLTALGYDSIAVHGMNGNLFNRVAWYTTIGFKQTWFLDELRKQGLPDCPGAFIGTCDAAVASWIGQRIAVSSTHPQFIHWMTLNSHLPVPVPVTDSLAGGIPCQQSSSLEPNTTLCSWYQLVANVHHSVSQLATGQLARPTVFVIVGDHAPPFADTTLRDHFSQSEVPYLILLPRRQSAIKTLMVHNGPAPILGRR